MSADHATRAQLVFVQVERIKAKAARCRDPEVLSALCDEMEVLHASLLEIREEQLMEQLERSKPKTKRRWWRRRREA